MTHKTTCSAATLAPPMMFPMDAQYPRPGKGLPGDTRRPPGTGHQHRQFRSGVVLPDPARRIHLPPATGRRPHPGHAELGAVRVCYKAARAFKIPRPTPAAPPCHGIPPRIHAIYMSPMLGNFFTNQGVGTIEGWRNSKLLVSKRI